MLNRTALIFFQFRSSHERVKAFLPIQTHRELNLRDFVEEFEKNVHIPEKIRKRNTFVSIEGSYGQRASNPKEKNSK
jgi:hypothetical protein